MLKLKCFSCFEVVVMIFIFSYIGIAILICSLVAMLTEVVVKSVIDLGSLVVDSTVVVFFGNKCNRSMKYNQ